MKMPIPSRARDVALAAVMFLPAALGACRPEPGGSCKAENKLSCVDEKKALACHEGKWEEMSCRGPAGCAKGGGEPVCDQTAAENGDACNLSDDFACSGDKKAMLQCSKNKWSVVASCIGEHGCSMEGRTVTCDNNVANAGDKCREENDHACSPDKKLALTCQKGQFVQASPCKGPEGCKVVSTDKGARVRCDDSIASVDDPCEKPDSFSCSSDERSILKCRGNKFALEEKCRAKDKCQVRNGQVGCY